ncbi:MAG TPA: DUF790 family protein, partial [Hyphomicrobiaceae bacterium]|nr:DUF790 family protein [Hyphomicrobiaceae bacterium]
SAAVPSDQFDSALESRLFAEFAGLERASEAHGWRIEREPEPIVAGETIYVPDFALTRGTRRIYLELAGYWRAEYRERKVRKLLALHGRMPLVVAAPESAREAFAALDGAYPLLFYGNRLSAPALLALLDRTYDDAAERLAALDAPAILHAVAAAGRIPAHEAMRLLACHTRAERDAALGRLAKAAATLGQPQPVWIAGAGLCSSSWREGIGERLAALVSASPGGRLPLAALCERITEDDSALVGADLTEEAVESLATHAGLEVLRASIFAAEVVAPGVPSPPVAAVSTDAQEASAQPRQSRGAQPRRPARRKVHDVNYAAPALLDVPDGDDAPKPDVSPESDS